MILGPPSLWVFLGDGSLTQIQLQSVPGPSVTITDPERTAWQGEGALVLVCQREAGVTAELGAHVSWEGSSFPN